MTIGIRLSACVISCLALAGCASSDLMVKRQSEAEAKIEYLLQADKNNMQRINDLTAHILSLEDKVKLSDVQLKQLQASIREISTQQTETTSRNSQATPPKIELVNKDATKSRDNGPPAGYVKAFGLYSSNNFSAAIKAFEEFLAQSPKSEYAINAHYWIGECYYSLSDLPKSLAAFQKVVTTYPKSSKAPDAMLKLGYTHAAMKEKGKATRTFEQLIKTYPGSPAAIKARERLTAN